jgi:AcrR family transcriptional regulator
MQTHSPGKPRRPDRRRARHEATIQEILGHAWAIARDQGVAGLSLSALARAVDMEPQSLYTYFGSKHALYDRMFADANTELLARLRQLEVPADQAGALRAVARLFLDFGTEDPARHQLLFTRAIPGFEPSPGAYAVAVEVVATGRSLLARAGLRRDADFDLWTALVSGLASQQLANDPGGDRYTRLVDDAADMFAAHILARDAAHAPTRGAETTAGNSDSGRHRAEAPNVKAAAE